MRIVFYLLDTLFFFLVAAALLRAWMNHLRVHMSVQPGRLAISMTNWLVVPLRRVLPSRWAKSAVDWGSLVAALLLALAYAVVWLLLAAGLAGALASPLAIPAMAVKLLLRVTLQGLMILLLAFAVLSWVQPQSPAMYTLERLSDPLLRPLRRLIPTVGGVDLSVLVLVVLLQVGLMLVG